MTRRCFLAFDLPFAVLDALSTDAELSARLYEGRSTVRGNLHITAGFFGNVKDSNLDKLGERLRSAFAGHAPLHFRFVKNSFAPLKSDSGRMVWSVFECEGFTSFVSEAYEAAQGLTDMRPPRRHETPHVTLVRFREPVSPVGELSAALAFGYEFTVNEVTLYESALAPGGPTYTALEKYGFAV